jgi:uncharacterized protein
LDKGYEVRTLVRDPDKLGRLKNTVQYFQGNIFNPEDIENAVSGSEVVISTIAPNKKKPEDPTLYQNAMKNMVSILEKNKIQKFIHIGGAAHLGGNNEEWDFKRKFLRVMLLLFSKKILKTKELEWEVLKQSGIKWILIRPSGIVTKKSSGQIVADESYLASLSINVDDLANFILEQVNSDIWVNKAPLISNK